MSFYTQKETDREVIEMMLTNSAHHYEMMPVVIQWAKGSRFVDSHGQEYLDMLAGYSVMNFGHRNDYLQHALENQLGECTLLANKFFNPVVARFHRDLVKFSGIKGRALVMNSGAEAVEKAIKLARKWGYERKGVKNGHAEIIVTDTNFHGRTLGVLSASRVYHYREGFGPFLPGFVPVEFGDVEDLERVINGNTVAYLVEPIQGEGGFIFPPDGYFKAVAEICKKHNVLLILDEIPTAFRRTGDIFPHQHDGIVPDAVILGKALGGGLLPVSAVVAREEVMDVLGPGDDGSTFGGNPLACAVGSAAIELIEVHKFADHVKEYGEYFTKALRSLHSPLVKEVRGRGLFIGVELVPEVSAHEVCVHLLAERVVTVEARQNVVRFTPPLVITKEEINFAIRAFARVLGSLGIQKCYNSPSA